MRRVIRNGVSEGSVASGGDILEVFFGLKKGILPDNLKEVHKQYKKELGVKGGCSSCRANGVKKKYRKAVLALV